MPKDGNAQCLGCHGHMDILVKVHSNFLIRKILLNPSVLALTCYEVNSFGWHPLGEQLVLPNKKGLAGVCLEPEYLLL